MKKIFLGLMVLCGLALAQINVVTTLPDFKNVTEIIGGDKVKVTALIKGQQDPHHYEIKPSDILTLRKADAVIMNGLELDDYWLLPLIDKSRNPRIQKGAPGLIDASAGVPVLEKPAGKVDRSMGDVHPQGNPHYTLSPEMMKHAVTAIAGQLSALYPEYAKEFQQNAENYNKELTQRLAQWREQLHNAPPIVVYHNSWAYFFADFGLSAAGYIEPKPGISPSPANLAALIASLKDRPRGIILQEVYENGDTAQYVAEQTGYRHIVVPTLVGGTKNAPDYVSLIDSLVKTIAENKK